MSNDPPPRTQSPSRFRRLGWFWPCANTRFGSRSVFGPLAPGSARAGGVGLRRALREHAVRQQERIRADVAEYDRVEFPQLVLTARKPLGGHVVGLEHDLVPPPL